MVQVNNFKLIIKAVSTHQQLVSINNQTIRFSRLTLLIYLNHLSILLQIDLPSNNPTIQPKQQQYQQLQRQQFEQVQIQSIHLLITTHSLFLQNKMKLKKQRTALPDPNIDDMILQLRQMINESSQRKGYPPSTRPFSNKQDHESGIVKTKLPSNIDSLIEESAKLIQTKQQTQYNNPQIRGKILAASELLKDEHPLIKQYVKEKIQSEVFSSEPVEKLTKFERFRLEQEKQALVLQKQQQIEQQQKRRKDLVSSVIEFQSNSRAKVGIHEIDQLIFQQSPQSSYLLGLTQTDSKKVSSKSNEVKNSNLYISQVYKIHEEERPLVRSRQQLEDLERVREFGDKEFTEIVDQTESHLKYEEQFADPKNEGLRQVLIKYPHVVKAVYQFVKNQYAIMNVKNGLNVVARVLAAGQADRNTNSRNTLLTNVEIPQGHIWKNQKKKAPKSSKLNRQQQTITDITQRFKFKGFAITEENKLEFQRQKISERRINKMIGESKNFHAKKCILTKKELVYFEEKQSADDSRIIELVIPQNTKYIDLEIQRILSDKFTREEGSFFSKKEIYTEIVTVKGKARVFKFQSHFLEGAQLVNDLKKLMAAKVYSFCCKANGENNLSLLNFINSVKSHSFDFCSQFMIQMQSFLKKQNRELYFKIMTDLFNDRQEVLTLSLQRSKLLSTQISDIVKESRKLTKLKSIDLSHLRLTKQNFQQICQCVNEIQSSKGDIEVCISDCRLDDDCFVSNVGVFTSFCSKVRKLDISDNMITSKTVNIIKGCLQNINSEIKQLNIGHCPIRELSKLNSLIKESRKLECLQADNCSLQFATKTVEQLGKFFDFVKKCNPNLRKISLAHNGSLNKEKCAIIKNNWNIQTIQQLIVDLDLQGNNKTEKQLLRTDNVANQKNFLLIKPILIRRHNGLY